MAARKTTTKKTTRTRKPARKTTRRSTSRTSVVSESTAISSESVKPASKINKKLVIVLVAIAALLYIFRGMFIVSFVNGTPIYRHTVVKRLEKLGGTQVVDELIQRELVSQEAAKRGVTVSQEEISEEVESIEETFEGQGVTLDEILAGQGVDRAEFEEGIELQIMMRKILSEDIKVEEEELQTYFDENEELFEGANFDEIKDELREQLEQERLGQRIGEWLAEIEQNASITTVVEY